MRIICVPCRFGGIKGLKIRYFYDTYGYPVSKHIRSAWAADVVYVIMKPLEWFFLMILYLFDEKPENRIASQYLPAKKSI